MKWWILSCYNPKPWSYEGSQILGFTSRTQTKSWICSGKRIGGDPVAEGLPPPQDTPPLKHSDILSVQSHNHVLYILIWVHWISILTLISPVPIQIQIQMTMFIMLHCLLERIPHQCRPRCNVDHARRYTIILLPHMSIWGGRWNKFGWSSNGKCGWGQYINWRWRW